MISPVWKYYLLTICWRVFKNQMICSFVTLRTFELIKTDSIETLIAKHAAIKLHVSVQQSLIMHLSMDCSMYNYSCFLLWFSVYSWIRVVLVTKIRSVGGTKEPSSPRRKKQLLKLYKQKAFFSWSHASCCTSASLERQICVQVLTVSHTPLAMTIPQGDGAKQSKTHRHHNSSIRIEQREHHFWMMWINGVSARRHRPRFMWPCQRQVNYCYTGRRALGPFPGQHKHSKPSPVSGSSVCRVENWSLSLMLAAGTVGDSPIFCLSLLSRVTHMCIIQRTWYTSSSHLFATEQRLPNTLLWKHHAMANTFNTS